MPEQIEPAALDQVLAGKTHDLSDLRAILRLVAMHRTMLAERLFLKRAAQASFKSIKQKFTTFVTDGRLVQRQVLQVVLADRDCRLVAGMLFPAVNCSK